MLSRLKFLLSYFLFWILFFEGARLLFLFYNPDKAREVSFNNKALSFLYGLRMDISVSSYILVPVCLFVIAGIFLAFFRKTVVYKVYSFIVLFFLLLITLADLEVYKSWGFRIDATPLKYLDSPKEVWASISHLPLVLIFFLFTLTYISLCFLLNRFLQKRMYLLQDDNKKILSASVLFIVTALLIIPMRGGLQLTPMNQSMVYFSKQNFANVVAVNASWNFMNGVAKGAPVVNPYHYHDNKVVKRITDSLYASGNQIQPILKTKDPNVIVIIWESLTKKAVEQSIQGRSIMPRFNELIKEGIYFNNLYASGDRTDKGVSAVLSGYPAMNNVSIIRYPNKSSKLNTLPGWYKSKGYHTSFYYGGETEFANIKSFLLQSHFEKLIDKNDFSSKDQNSKWGAHDGVVASKILTDLQKEQTPFFVSWLTLSSHEPFETPVGAYFNGDDHASKFANSLHYADQAVYDFIQQCKKQSWWNNTVVVIIADHGHGLLKPSNWIENFKIPMLWLGGALDTTGITVNKVASQIDLATTLVKQSGESQNLFPFSKNIFDTTVKPWAYFSFNNGFGFMQPQQQFVFDNVGKQLIIKNGKVSEIDINAGKAMQQFSFQDYIDK